MAIDPNTLFDEGKCYTCYGLASEYQILKLALLRRISLASNPANDVSPNGLLAQAKCLGCNSYASEAKMMELALLQQIAGG